MVALTVWHEILILLPYVSRLKAANRATSYKTLESNIKVNEIRNNLQDKAGTARTAKTIYLVTNHWFSRKSKKLVQLGSECASF